MTKLCVKTLNKSADFAARDVGEENRLFAFHNVYEIPGAIIISDLQKYMTQEVRRNQRNGHSIYEIKVKRCFWQQTGRLQIIR